MILFVNCSTKFIAIKLGRFIVYELFCYFTNTQACHQKLEYEENKDWFNQKTLLGEKNKNHETLY
jgi:hypothetical protein